MPKSKLIRITTVPISLEKLLEGQVAFMKSYYEVVAISAEKERLEAYGEKEKVRTFHVALTREITPLKDLAAVFKLYKFLKKEKPTIVHTHTPKAGIVGMMAAWLAGTPNRLHTVAGLPLMEATGFKRKLLDFVEKLTYGFATRVYPNSRGLYEFILAEKYTKPSKLSIIGNGSSNGIDTTYFDPVRYAEEEKNNLRRELGIADGNFVFVFVGRLVGDKGINELIKAYGMLNSEFRIQNSTLLLVGPMEPKLDPLKPETLTSIESNPNIISVGFQQDVRPYFAISDALVFPSYREGFPNVVMQAGAMGLPAIVTDINGCNEIIIQNVNGVIIPPKNSEAIIAAMVQLMEDQLLYERLKSKAREQITSRFERKQVWEALLEEYKRLLKAE